MVVAFAVWAASVRGLAMASPVSVVGGLVQEFTLEPGGRAEGNIELRNNTDQPQEVRVYLNDYMFWARGEVAFGEPGSTPRSNARWITLAPQQLTLPPKGIDSVYYVIQVPPDENLKGTYWSVLMVEPVARQLVEPPAEGSDQVRMGLAVVLRYAVQMAVHIGQTGERSLRFAEKRLVGKEGKQILELDVENTGERKLRPVVWAELFDAGGRSLGRFEGGRWGIYPGCSVRCRIDLSQVPAGKYRALVVADNGDEYVFGAQYELELTAQE